MASTPPPTVVDATYALEENELAPAELKRRLDQGEELIVLDVREPAEFDAWHIPGARNLPLSELQAGTHVEAEDDQTIVTVCASGHRSGMAQDTLVRRGHHVLNLAGGMLGWNRVYEIVDATVKARQDGSGTTVLQVQRIGKGCLSYMILNEGQAAVIDPARDTRIYKQAAQAHGAEITVVLDTHAHADHVSGGPALARELGVDYRLHAYDAIHPIDLVPATVDYVPVEDGEEIGIGQATLRALHIPGHTLGNLALLVDATYLLTGDSIFVDSIARPDLGGKADAWTALHHRSLNRLLELPGATRVLPGHFGGEGEAREDGVVGASLEELERSNRGLQMAARDQATFEAFIQASLPTFPDRYVEIKRVNAGLVDPDDDGLDDLEFGKQACAVSDR